ncbi:MAG: nuclear transport factor 2 family protein [Pseudomonadota bacterium]
MDTADKLAIGELLARSAYGLDLKDLSTLEGCFAASANFSLAIEGVPDVARFEGRDAIMGLFKGALDDQTDERKHVISNIFFRDTTGDRATVLSYLTLFATEHGETQLITTGLYTDQVMRDGSGNWLITDRDLKLDRPY